jgi:GAF domain-containing protein
MVLRPLETAFKMSESSGIFYLRRNFTLLLAGIVMVSAIVGIIAQLLTPAGLTSAIYSNISAVAAAALSAYLVIKQRVTAAAIFLLLPLVISLVFIKAYIPLFIIGIIIAVGAAVTFPAPLFWVISAFIVVRFGIALAQLLTQTELHFTDEVAAVVAYASILLIVLLVTRYLIDTAIRLNRDSVRTAELLQATSQVSQLLSGTLSQEELFSRAVETIRDRFAFYHVQIFLMDEQRLYANLVASTGEVGQRLMARGHRLAVGSKSVIGRVTQIGEPVLAHDDDHNTVHMVNEFLPHTRSELALPLIDNDRIIGALDVQSTRPHAFSPSDVQALLTLAGQLTTAIRNARLFEQQQDSVQQNQQLLLQAQASLREIQRLNTQLNNRAWEEYLNERRDEVGVKIDNEQTTSHTQWTTAMIEAALEQRVTTRDTGDRAITAVPIILRGELLGVIEVEGENLRDEDVVEMVQAVAQNLAITLDSVRLLEEVQTVAAQEQRISAIVDRYQSASSVDELMKVTLEELAQTLGADEGTIRLSTYGHQFPIPAPIPANQVSDVAQHSALLPASDEARNDAKSGTNGLNHPNGSSGSAGAAGMNGASHSD